MLLHTYIKMGNVPYNNFIKKTPFATIEEKKKENI